MKNLVDQKKWGMRWYVFLLILIIGIQIFPDFNEFNFNQEKLNNLQTPLPTANPIMKEIYVSPSGNDSANGSLTDPFRTIQRAQQAVRSENNLMNGDIIVYLREGIYFLNETLKFNQIDSGSGDYQVIYKNFPSESPKISGGKLLSGWQPSSSNLWEMECEVEDFRQLYLNEERMVRARGDASNITKTTGDGHSTTDKSMQSWRNLQDIEFVYQDIWTLPRVHPYFIKEQGGEYFIYMQQPAYSFTRYKPDSQNQAPSWIENAYELLDEPGEWYLDRTLDKLFYYPQNGENMNTIETVVPVLDVLVNISGSALDKVHNLQFEGLQFCHGTWLAPNIFGQNFVEVQANHYRTEGENQWVSVKSPGNLIMEYAQNISFLKCNVTHMGTTGLEIGVGVNQSSVIGCMFNDISGTGIQIGETNNPNIHPSDPDVVGNILIMNNYLVNCCVEYKSGVGIFGGYIRNVRIEHNTISNLPYTGISLGWGWSATETICANNSVKYNHIYGIMNFLRDGGGIYTLSTQPGTNISYNVIHDCGWNGLYPDERTNQTYWTWNVVYDTDNNFLDHSMYAESYWNVVENNYLEDYPKHLWVWYPDRDNDQIWNLKPGDTDFPQWIVNMAGVQPEYRYLIPEHENYWHYQSEATPNILDSNKIFKWGGYSLILLVGLVGILSISLGSKIKLPNHSSNNPNSTLNQEEIASKMKKSKEEIQ